MSNQDSREWRDDVSIWCYDGACATCDDDDCEHHCHTVDDRVRVEGAFAARGAAVIGLATWGVIGVYTMIPDDWDGIAGFGIRGLVIVLTWLMCRFVVTGLDGFRKGEQ